MTASIPASLGFSCLLGFLEVSPEHPGSLDKSEKRCHMTCRDYTPLTAVPQKIANRRPAGDLT